MSPKFHILSPTRPDAAFGLWHRRRGVPTSNTTSRLKEGQCGLVCLLLAGMPVAFTQNSEAVRLSLMGSVKGARNIHQETAPVLMLSENYVLIISHLPFPSLVMEKNHFCVQYLSISVCLFLFKYKFYFGSRSMVFKTSFSPSLSSKLISGSCQLWVFFFVSVIALSFSAKHSRSIPSWADKKQPLSLLLLVPFLYLLVFPFSLFTFWLLSLFFTFYLPPIYPT